MALCPDMGNDGDNLRHGCVITDDHGPALAVGVEKLVGIFEVPAPHDL